MSKHLRKQSQSMSLKGIKRGEFLQNGVTVIFGFDFGSSSGWWQQRVISEQGCNGWIVRFGQ
jgi:hypothetical protein